MARAREGAMSHVPFELRDVQHPRSSVMALARGGEVGGDRAGRMVPLAGALARGGG